MAPKPKVLIIGAGMAGLSAGVYARLNGFPATIIEQQHRAGGLCQSWERESFCINGCVHWLVGSSGRGDFPDLWHDLGILPEVSFYDHDRLMSFDHPEGKVHLFADPDRLQQHLCAIAPEDEASIRSLCKAVRVVMQYDMPQADDRGGFAALLGQVRMLFTHFPLIRHSLRWWRLTIGDFAASLKNPLLRRVFSRVWHDEMSMITLVMTLAFLARRDAGYPLGGSSRLIRPVEERFRELGGTLRLGKRVSSVIVEHGVAKGVRLNNEEEIRADYVISAIDAYTTLYGLLRGEYPDPRLLDAFDQMQPFPPILLAGLGVARTFPEWKPSVMGAQFPLNPPAILGSRRRDYLEVQAYTFDQSLAPAGNTLLTVYLESDFDFWREKAARFSVYRECKRKTLDQIIAALERFFPGLGEQVIVRDLATPVTFHQYTGNYRGSYEGWLPTPEALRTELPKQLEGLDHFFLAGHWVEPGGGLPPAAMSGRRVVQAICRKEKRPFRTWRGQSARQAEPVP